MPGIGIRETRLGVDRNTQVIIDVGESAQSACIEAALPLLSKSGVILTIEPEVPTGDADEEDAVGVVV